jgi:hypothetical protein
MKLIVSHEIICVYEKKDALDVCLLFYYLAGLYCGHPKEIGKASLAVESPDGDKQ